MQAQLDLTRRLHHEIHQSPRWKAEIEAVGHEIGRQNGRAAGTPTGIASKLSGYEEA